MPTLRDLLLAFHLFWDFSWEEWCAWEKNAWAYSPEELAALIGCSLFPGKTAPDSWQEALEVSQTISFQRMCASDGNFPPGLRRLSRIPPVLYFMGTPPPPLLGLVTIVGTRKTSALGERSSYRFAHELGSIGLGIASGLALGVDAAAHQGALDSGAYTIAVLGNAMGDVYPPEHQELAAQIVTAGGTIMTEFPPGTALKKYFFPRRNSILAALPAGVLVTEAPLKSGAQITAKAALAIGVPVAVLLRNFDESAGEGATHLLRNSAWPALHCQDLLEYFSFGNCGQALLLNGDPLDLPEIFSLEEFCERQKGPFLQRVRRLQQLLRAGLVKEISPSRYQFQGFRPAQKRKDFSTE